LHQRSKLRDQRLLGVSLLMVDGVAGRQFFIAVEVDLGIGELG